MLTAKAIPEGTKKLVTINKTRGKISPAELNKGSITLFKFIIKSSTRNKRYVLSLKYNVKTFSNVSVHE
ncbi:hypothetical protein FACS1894155_01150 [Bacteroidia bacterium]|nr:hypothetical protein FACS189455_2460 [Bacteroidia bacterium]GHU87690.1 hypothetical protein FACS1894155_01150 [Bacteroidia bacterium]